MPQLWKFERWGFDERGWWWMAPGFTPSPGGSPELRVERDVIGALLGHSTTSITVAHYAPVTWTEMAQAITRLHYAEHSRRGFLARLHPTPHA